MCQHRRASPSCFFHHFRSSSRLYNSTIPVIDSVTLSIGSTAISFFCRSCWTILLSSRQFPPVATDCFVIYFSVLVLVTVVDVQVHREHRAIPACTHELGLIRLQTFRLHSDWLLSVPLRRSLTAHVNRWISPPTGDQLCVTMQGRQIASSPTPTDVDSLLSLRTFRSAQCDLVSGNFYFAYLQLHILWYLYLSDSNLRFFFFCTLIYNTFILRKLNILNWLNSRF